MAANTSQSNPKTVEKLSRAISAHPKLFLALVVIVTLSPFLTKPFNFDDPLFLWAARQIQTHPLDPYGFKVNWYGNLAPMWQVTKNPPLACYYLALAGKLFGWGEVALHTAFLLPALLVILGVHRLARQLCDQPLLAALITLFTPAFLVSSSSVMCDVCMVAFWVWATTLWVEGIKGQQPGRLALAATLIALAAVTKYFGMCLIPLLGLYGFMHRRNFGTWTLCLIIPGMALGGYEWATSSLYGQGLLSDAEAYANGYRDLFGTSRAVTLAVAFGFTGGCLAIATFFLPMLWSNRSLAVFAVIAAGLAGIFWFSHAYTSFATSSRSMVASQLFFWTLGGVGIVSLAAVEAWKNRDADSALLAAWVLGTFIFVALFNWDVNGRTLLPMDPAVAILVVRRLSRNKAGDEKHWQRSIRLRFGVGAIVALIVARGDYQIANAVRRSAIETCARYQREGRTLWFEGHWGFQYYMERAGAKPATMDWAAAKSGDLVAIPFNNSNTSMPANNVEHPEPILFYGGPKRVTTLGTEVGASFYASILGPLPFAYGHVLPAEVLVLTLDFKSPPPP